jgi:hypothetical protein
MRVFCSGTDGLGFELEGNTQKELFEQVITLLANKSLILSNVSSNLSIYVNGRDSQWAESYVDGLLRTIAQQYKV